MASTAVVLKTDTFTCPHSGTGTISNASTKLTVDSIPVVTLTEVLTMTILGCTHIDPNPSGGTPCLTLISATPGSTTLKKGGVVVSLDTDIYTTNATVGGPPIGATITITTGNTKLTAKLPDP